MNVNRLVIVTLVNIIYSASHIHQISSSIVALLECIEIGVCSSSNILTYYCHVYISQLLLRSRLLLIMIACALLASTYQLRSIAQLLQYIHPLISVVITRLRLSLRMRHTQRMSQSFFLEMIVEPRLTLCAFFLQDFLTFFLCIFFMRHFFRGFTRIVFSLMGHFFQKAESHSD